VALDQASGVDAKSAARTLAPKLKVPLQVRDSSRSNCRVVNRKYCRSRQCCDRENEDRKGNRDFHRQAPVDHLKALNSSGGTTVRPLWGRRSPSRRPPDG
jgi:hypothetical protein